MIDDGKQKTMEDLYKEANHNPIVKSFLNSWRYGDFQSLESMLITLACVLSNERRYWIDTAMQISLESTCLPSPDLAGVVK